MGTHYNPASKGKMSIVSILQDLGLPHAVLHLTDTGLRKSTLDATAAMREFLVDAQIHDYAKQRQGPEFKVIRPAAFFSLSGFKDTRISFNRPRSGNGDPRLWIRGLGKFAAAGTSIALVAWEDKLIVIGAEDLAGLQSLVGESVASGRATRHEARDACHGNSINEEEGTVPYRNELVQAVYRRGFGGEAAVVVPGLSIDCLPSASPAAGVDEACEVLLDALTSGGKTGACVFLIGGPGNGKSHVLSRLLGELGLYMTPREGNLAPRSDVLDVNGMPFLVVNDASIRPGEAAGNVGAGDLAQDIRMLLEKVDQGDLPSALVCINRGILIEELARVPRDPSWQRERSLIEWLQSDCDATADATNGEFTRTRPLVGEDGPVALAVFLDRLSLLERQPQPLPGKAAEFGRYRVAPLRSTARLESPAAELLGKLVDSKNFEDAQCSGCPAEKNCPFLANARSLRSDAVGLGVLDTTRMSEIVSGHLATYRDLWALYAALIVGVDRPEFAEGHPCEWVQDLLLDYHDSGDAVGEEQLRALVAQRYYEAVFPSLGELGNKAGEVGWSETPPIIKRLQAVDPAKDSAGSWAGIVDAAVEAVAYGELPLSAIVKECPEFRGAVAPIDEEIGKFVLYSLVSDSEDFSETDRSRALRWRGLSLYRHFGFSMGHGAQLETVQEWIRLRSSVGPREQDLPFGPLQAALNQLILPTAEHDSRYCLLPVFEPRVEPIVQRSEVPIWCQALQAAALVSWKVYARGDALWLRLWVTGRPQAVSEFQLDFALCREALAQCVCNSIEDQACMPGFTDFRSMVSPRLERVRASFLASAAGLQRNLVVAHSRLSGVTLP